MTVIDRNLAYDTDLEPDEIIRVGGGSDPQAVASAISNAFYERHEVTLRAIGASAVNQANKAIAIARGYVATRGLDLYCRQGFTNVQGPNDAKPISAIVLRLNLQ